MAVTLIDSGSEKAQYPDLSELDGAAAMSVAFTFKPTASTASAESLVHRWGGVTNDQTFLVNIQDTNEIGFLVKGSSTTRGVKSSSLNFASGTTYRICCVWAAPSTMWIYVDGVSVEGAWLTNTVSALYTNATVLQVGYNTAIPYNTCDGEYSELCIWDSNLSASQAVMASTGKPLLLIDPANRIFYDPMYNTSSNDLVGGKAATYTGGANAAHPATYRHSAQILQFPPVAAASGRSHINPFAGPLSMRSPI